MWRPNVEDEAEARARAYADGARARQPCIFWQRTHAAGTCHTRQSIDEEGGRVGPVFYL